MVDRYVAMINMQFEIRKSQYGYMQFLCPFCGGVWRPLKNRIIHLSSMARHEAMKKSLANEYPSPHLDFYTANTHEIVITRREWNEDFVNMHCDDLLKKC